MEAFELTFFLSFSPLLPLFYFLSSTSSPPSSPLSSSPSPSGTSGGGGNTVSGHGGAVREAQGGCAKAGEADVHAQRGAFEETTFHREGVTMGAA
jgi:hypothetical protein